MHHAQALPEICHISRARPAGFAKLSDEAPYAAHERRLGNMSSIELGEFFNTVARYFGVGVGVSDQLIKSFGGEAALRSAFLGAGGYPYEKNVFEDVRSDLRFEDAHPRDGGVKGVNTLLTCFRDSRGFQYSRFGTYYVYCTIGFYALSLALGLKKELQDRVLAEIKGMWNTMHAREINFGDYVATDKLAKAVNRGVCNMIMDNMSTYGKELAEWEKMLRELCPGVFKE